jgi:hypothetical protein
LSLISCLIQQRIFIYLQLYAAIQEASVQYETKWPGIQLHQNRGKGLLSQKEKDMLQNPFLLMPSAANAWAEGFTKGFVAKSSPAPSENVASEDIAAFNQGVAAGAESARSGISLGDRVFQQPKNRAPCMFPGW